MKLPNSSLIKWCAYVLYWHVHVPLSFRFAFIYLILFCFIEKRVIFAEKIFMCSYCWWYWDFVDCKPVVFLILWSADQYFFVILWALRVCALLIMLSSCELATFETAFGTSYSKISYFFKLLCNWMPLTIVSNYDLEGFFFAILYSLLIE